ncbi:interaptin-like isoform X2 [Pectinophora gossypiella]|uniref:interaptin-like isoform X2 n=1 Tax=Pectinophora gossypiella TaxID=13191 RepID=UPI00214E1D91|nr:interaptin-like isoform X2 [Pectinophora gossypiella]
MLTKYAGYTRPAPVPTMPPGVVELMEGLTKEVLRHNPADMYQFCADHFEQLLVIRDGRAPKKTLTLEQKINRAQQKVRERAEHRRRKYDEEMKKYVEEMKCSSNVQDEPATDKLKSPELVQDSKLKAPVHHDQDLTDAKEVEIFHKPIEETKIEKVFATNIETINNTNDSSLVKDILEKENETTVNEELKQLKGKGFSQEEIPATNLDSTISDIDGILENNKSYSVDNIIENGNEDVRTELNRVRRSVAPVESHKKVKQVEEVDIREAQIENPQEAVVLLNHPEAKMEEVKDISLEKEERPNDVANAEKIEKENIEATDTIVNKENNTGIDSSNNKYDTIDRAEPENDIDKAEMAETEIETPKGETLDSNVTISTKELYDEATMNVISELESADLKVGSNSEKPDKNAVETKEEITNILEPTDESLEKQAETFENVDNIKDTMPEIVGIVDMKADDKLLESHELTNAIDTLVEEKLLPEIENVEQKKQELKYELAEPGETKDSTYSQKGFELTEETKSEPELLDQGSKLQNADTVFTFTGNRNLLDQNIESQKEKMDTLEISTHITEASGQSDEAPKANAVSTEIESSNVLQVVAEDNVSEEQSIVENDKTLDIIPEMKTCEVTESENNSNDDDTEDVKKGDNETTPKSEADSAAEENVDDSLTTINKVLVDESAIVNDDNDSVPVEITTTNGTEQNLNGRYENGKETPDSEAISTIEESSNQEIAKDVQNVPDIQDNLSTASEPIKTDNETSSIGKSSSMDDSFIEDSTNSILEVELKETNAESTQNKESSSSMDLETAAVTIQKVFRSFLFKSRCSTFDDTGADDSNSIDNDHEKLEVQYPVSTTPLNKERRTLGRMDTVLQTVNEEKSLSLSTDDSSLSSAATIIQAHVRGFLVRNRRNSNKTNSTSLVNSDGRSTSLEADSDQKANKTVLNIHIVPEGDHFLSRDESLLTSIDLSLDGSPPSSTNLHPLGYDKSEPRKQLKREDAIQSISPPSNNSGKLSEDVDSVKDMIISDEQQKNIDNLINEPQQNVDVESRDDTPTKSTTIETVIEAHKILRDESSSPEEEKNEAEIVSRRKESIAKYNSDENDVITPFEEKVSLDSGNTSRLLHSGEFHDVVLPTKVSRNDTSVVREFKNVLAYFIIWNNS